MKMFIRILLQKVKKKKIDETVWKLFKITSKEAKWTLIASL